MTNMKNVLIRNIEEELLDRLKEKAAANKRSLQAELKNALEVYAGPPKIEVVKRIKEIQDSFKKRNIVFSDSAEEIRKMRESR